MAGQMSLGWFGGTIRPTFANSSSDLTEAALRSRLNIALQTCGLTLFSQNEKNDLTTAVSADVGTGVAALYVSGAEAGKTASMIAKALRLMTLPIKDAKKKLRLTRKQLRTPEGRAKILDEANNAWLEGRYGWRPFIYDVMSWFDARSTPKAQRYTARAQRTKTAQSTTYRNMGKANQLGMVRIMDELAVKVTLRAGQLAEFRPQINGYAQSFGLYDVMGTAWDIIPYSFVYDWFCNLGDVAKALQAYALVDRRIGWYTEITTAELKHTPGVLGALEWHDAYTSLRYMALPVGYSFVETLRLKRRTPVDIFIPTFAIRCELNITKIVDLAALLRNLLR